jgi:hypothetical protein
MSEEKPSAPKHGGSGGDQWGSLIIIVFLALLVGGGLWLANALSDANSKLECLESGRTNCAPITPNGR